MKKQKDEIYPQINIIKTGMLFFDESMLYKPTNSAPIMTVKKVIQIEKF